jgi:hypothetical protein
MSFSNLNFSRIFIHERHRLYICKHNLQAAIEGLQAKGFEKIHSYIHIVGSAIRLKMYAVDYCGGPCDYHS